MVHYNIIVVDAGTFLDDFIRQSLLPKTLPINAETLKMLKDDDRKVVLTVLEDEFDETSMQLIKVLRSAANANHDLVFGYVGVKQWEEFTEPFHDSKSSQLPKMVVWDKDEEYEVVSMALLLSLLVFTMIPSNSKG
jgi:protein disulfide-isomerase A1